MNLPWKSDSEVFAVWSQIENPFRVSVSLSIKLCQHYPSPRDVWFASGKHSACKWTVQFHFVCVCACMHVGDKTRKQLHFKFDHRSFIIKHDEITWLPPRSQAQQLEVLADGSLEGHWDPGTLMFTGRAWSSSSVSSWSCTWNDTT